MPSMCNVAPYSFFLLDTTCFGLIDHLQVYRLLWLRILLLTVMQVPSTIVASGYFGYKYVGCM
jgi:hypothetical protein